MSDQYKKLFELCSEACLITTADGRVEEANEAAQNLLGGSLEALCGQHLSQFVVAAERSRLQQRLAYMATAAQIPAWEMSFQTATQPVRVQVNADCIATSQGQLIVCWCLKKLQESQIISEVMRQSNQAVDAAIHAETQELKRINRALQQKIKILRRQRQLTQQELSQERLIDTISQRIYECTELDEILDTTVAQVRLFLRTDRVVLYRFKPDWSGTVAVESVSPGVMPILYTHIEESCFRDGYISLYEQGRVRAIADIYTAEIDACHLELLRGFGVRANLVVPVLQEGRLWGLLIAHHCRSPRCWSETEIQLLSKIAMQFGIAVYQAELYEHWQTLATMDGLTGVANRRRFDHYLEECWQEQQTRGSTLTLILADIDFFKQYNDCYGHPAGDTCLKRVASTIQSVFRRSQDLVARYGGEEFVILLPDTEEDAAVELLGLLRRRLQALAIQHQESHYGYLTLSFGLASMTPRLAIAPTDLLNLADRALYQAKAQGRNRIALPTP
ncbi:diguanylate cyclase domain-containing protein [Leptolyngbya iicbica]|uniref:Diguanylate cyclase n=2 Tax=Cyanophyceae TaxID=3028117 RepID=A0A4Q7E0S8_9CYAN|nr:diguanylate cyclase [Leptolyngbya sp. LK]RZM74118.1 diguanylate cyclase [Leptolyngbya sp. LK]